MCVCLFVYLCADLSLVRFISAELTRGYFLEHNEAKYTERRERVYTCLRIPKELEKVPNTIAQSNTINTQKCSHPLSTMSFITPRVRLDVLFICHQTELQRYTFTLLVKNNIHINIGENHSDSKPL